MQYLNHESWIKHIYLKRIWTCVRGEIAQLAILKSKSIQVVILLKETAEIETGMAEKSGWFLSGSSCPARVSLASVADPESKLNKIYSWKNYEFLQ